MSTNLKNQALEVENIGNKRWRLTRALSFFSKRYNLLVTAPSGIETDYASTPRIFWSILPPDGAYTKAAILHDYLLDASLSLTKKQINLVFYDAMLECGVPTWKAKIMYWGVELFRIFR